MCLGSPPMLYGSLPMCHASLSMLHGSATDVLGFAADARHIECRCAEHRRWCCKVWQPGLAGTVAGFN
jgi:hypothetical protein